MLEGISKQFILKSFLTLPGMKASKILVETQIASPIGGRASQSVRPYEFLLPFCI